MLAIELYLIGAIIFGLTFFITGTKWASFSEGGFMCMTAIEKEQKILRTMIAVWGGLIWLIGLISTGIIMYKERKDNNE